ncbi:hypothetical protein LSTR_LSTR015479 [Laodelphax striatellus]|uniref:Uncharacterized protein n=1 Tax=Laodelphax striatellus TaxID=195883 RepID=A0A482WFX4_LAOST|nr:hypothetical protein LSTR_LSTR015479 [Laodelphax striatellus]
MAICFRSFPNRFITANVNNCIATRKHVHRTVSSRDYPNESLCLNKYTEESCLVSNACLFDSVFSDERTDTSCTRNKFPSCKVPARPNYTALAKERCPIPDDIILWKSGIGSEVMKLNDNYKSSLTSSSWQASSSSNEFERNLMNLYRSYLSATTAMSRENLESVLVLSNKLNMSSQETMPKPKASSSSDSDLKPTNEQLENILQVLSKDLPYIFIRPLDYTIYDHNLIFENNYRGVRMVGLTNYMTSISLMKLASHLRWYDGFSVFHVNGEGKIYKHVLDKMQPDDDKQELVHKTPLAAKLGLLLGLTPRSSTLSDLSPMAWSSVTDLSERDARLVTQVMAQLMLPLEKIE